MKDESFKDHVLDQFSDWEDMRTRRMFGGWGFYKGDLFFAIVADGGLYFKVNDSNRADYEAAGSHPFTYTKQGKEMTISYWLVPEAVLEDREQLYAWAEKAVEVQRRSK